MTEEPSPGVGELATLLGRRGAESPQAPWLFFREGFDWRWRSWGRLSDQVARGAESCRAWACAHNPEKEEKAAAERIGLQCRTVWHPDSIAAILAIAAAGFDAHLVEQTSSSSAALGLPGSEGEPALPECRAALDRYQPAGLEVTAAENRFQCGSESASDWWGLPRLEAAVEHFDELAAPKLVPRPILFASGSGDEALLAVLLAWSLRSGAAWVLGEDADDFAGIAWWARPTILVGSAAELESLATHFDRSARRRSRFGVVISTDRPLTPKSDEALGAASRCLALDS